MTRESIVDASVPSAGRIYDYMLGGHHNFDVDRQAAQQIMQLLPFLPKAMRLQRWCLQDVAEELAVRRGFDVIFDFASGLPTQDHIHTVVPSGTTVIYSDYDPVVVEYAREILGDTPNVYFFEADARRPEELLNRPEVIEILGNRRDVGLVYWGIGLFLTDEEFAYVAQTLYNWSGPNSCWALNAQASGTDPDNPAVAEVMGIYQRMGSALYMRSLARYEELSKPWKADPRGYVAFPEWHGLDELELSNEDRDAFGPTGSGYGAFLVK